ncbi:hypothetical protein B0H19DRAFT_1267073 [Mycena capillaripes]|nr:hypothetical protein B0H19DRAFT_1267073 [Mycena capillaripes]
MERGSRCAREGGGPGRRAGSRNGPHLLVTDALPSSTTPSPPMRQCATHFALNVYLFRFHLAPSPDCELCLVPETVPHYLLVCPRYRRERLNLIRRLGTARISLRRLLAAKSDPKPVLGLVRETGCFTRYQL